MGLSNIVAIAVIFLVIGGAVAYIIKAKHSGKKCIGCPDSGSCGGACHCCDGCHNEEPDQDKKEKE